MTTKFLGMVMTPLDVQVEGLAPVMDRIEATGATAINCGRSLCVEVPKGQGHRAPPLDIDGYRRVFDRPVWGKRELYLRSHPVDMPDLSLYKDTIYKPGFRAPPPELDRNLPDQIYAEARRRGWKIYNSASPLSVPLLAEDDHMRWVDGSIPDPDRRVASQGCPSAPNVRAYAIATILDTIGRAPQIDGICIDWLEYTTYLLEDHFLCFCPHCQRSARELGYDAGSMEEDALILWNHLHALTPASLQASRRMSHSPSELVELFMGYPGWLDLLRFKAEVIRLLFGAIRQAMNEAGYDHIELVPNGWAPPFNHSSGLDYARLPGIVQAVRPKLYTFHWSALPRWYGQTLKAWNPNLDEGDLIAAVKDWFQLPDANDQPQFSHYHIPGPEEDHPIDPATFLDRISEVVGQVQGKVPVLPLAHAYRPARQWRQKIEIVRDSPADGMWVQRFCYLSDEKLDILGQVWRGESA